jgi:hypothetical protein
MKEESKIQQFKPHRCFSFSRKVWFMRNASVSFHLKDISFTSESNHQLMRMVAYSAITNCKTIRFATLTLCCVLIYLILYLHLICLSSNFLVQMYIKQQIY